MQYTKMMKKLDLKLPPLKLITFDVTGTLLKFRSGPGQQYTEIGALYGVSCDTNVVSKNFHHEWETMTKKYPNFGRETMGWQEWWKIIVFRSFKDMNVEEQKLEQISKHLIECYKTMTCWEQSYGALGLLCYLKNRNVPLGIISNFDERLCTTLRSARLRHYFKFVLTSYAAGFEKPDVRIFEQAMNKSEINLLKPHECLHIGDTVDRDFVGAKKAGWNALLVNDAKFEEIQKKCSDIKEDHVFKNLGDLHTFLATRP